MNPVVAVIAPGAMGARVGERLTGHGLKVLTSLAGRSAETVARARAAGLTPASDQDIASVDIILSILPPGEALPLAQRLAPALMAASREAGNREAANRKPIYVDCNAVSPTTVERIAAVVAATGAAFVDAGIIGSPPKPGSDGPTFYVSGPDAPRVALLGQYGLDIRVLEGPLGAASALKMSYGGITKGMTAIAAAMLLAASRAGSADALWRELQDSQPQLLAWFTRQIGGMYPKAYRWVAEMEEVSDFAGGNDESKQIYAGIARFYEHMARDFAADQNDVNALKAFLVGPAEDRTR